MLITLLVFIKQSNKVTLVCLNIPYRGILYRFMRQISLQSQQLCHSVGYLSVVYAQLLLCIICLFFILALFLCFQLVDFTYGNVFFGRGISRTCQRLAKYPVTIVVYKL